MKDNKVLINCNNDKDLKKLKDSLNKENLEFVSLEKGK